MFKKIFDLKAKDVEDFVINLIKENYKLKNDDIFLKVEWHPSDEDFEDEFYVHEEPVLHLDEKNNWLYKDEKITLKDYFNLASNHWHFSFSEIYALMTNETELKWEPFEDEEIKLYTVIYKKEYYTVIYNKKENSWYISEWIDENPDDPDTDSYEVRKEVPKEIMEYINKNGY